jgi:hypothetical protein
MVTRSSPLGLGVTGPLTLGANHAFALHDLTLAAGTYRARMTVHSAGVNLGITAHGPAPAVQAKSDALEGAWLSGGSVEEFLFDAPTPGAYALAVWKVARQDLSFAASYTLEVTQEVVGAGPAAPAGTPSATRLHAAVPNPFTRSTAIAFDLASHGDVRLEVFDVTGARVATLAQGRWSAGRHSVSWEGSGDGGRSLAAGVYLVRLTTPGFTSTRRVARMR